MQTHVAPETDAAPYLFTARELARLAIYRAAIVARFYTDELEAIVAPRTRGLGKLAVR